MIVRVCVCVLLMPFLYGNVYISQARTPSHTDGRRLLCLKQFHVKDKQMSTLRTAQSWAIRNE